MAEPIFMKLGKYNMPHEAISTAYIINPSHQQYQHHSFSNFWGEINIAWTSVPIFMKLGM
jgi:hypothetical protein